MNAWRWGKAWVKASRLPSQLYILTPLLAGQLYALRLGYPWDWVVFILVHVFGLCLQLFIVFANDLADYPADRNNRWFTLFSGGSRVLVDGQLSSRSLRWGAWIMGLGTLTFAGILAVRVGHIGLGKLGVLGILLLLMYSFRPVRLNYRGGGEWLQMLGTAVILPLFGWLAQAGTFRGFPFALLGVLAPTMLACAIGTSLPDEWGDRASGKNSAAVFFGQRKAKWVTIALHGLTLGMVIVWPTDEKGLVGLSLV